MTESYSRIVESERSFGLCFSSFFEVAGSPHESSTYRPPSDHVLIAVKHYLGLPLATCCASSSGRGLCKEPPGPVPCLWSCRRAPGASAPRCRPIDSILQSWRTASSVPRWAPVGRQISGSAPRLLPYRSGVGQQERRQPIQALFWRVGDEPDQLGALEAIRGEGSG